MLSWSVTICLAVKLFDVANQGHCYIVNSLRTWEYPIGDPVQFLNWFLAWKWGCVLLWPEVSFFLLGASRLVNAASPRSIDQKKISSGTQGTEAIACRYKLFNKVKGFFFKENSSYSTNYCSALFLPYFLFPYNFLQWQLYNTADHGQTSTEIKICQFELLSQSNSAILITSSRSLGNGQHIRKQTNRWINSNYKSEQNLHQIEMQYQEAPDNI